MLKDESVHQILFKKGVNWLSEFEKQVRHALIDHDMTMTDLANSLGLSVSYTFEIVVGTRKSEKQKERIRQILSLPDIDEHEEEQDVNCTNSNTDEC